MARRPASSDELIEALRQEASAAVRRRFKDSISQRADEALAFPSMWFSTGSLGLDRILRGANPGGIPGRRVTHIAGDPSVGKSVILDHVLLSCQQQGGIGLVSETEGTRDPHFAHAIGLNLKRLEIQRPKTLEELFDSGLEWHDHFRAKKTGKDIPIVWGIDSLDSTEAEKSALKGMTESGGWHYGGGKSEALGVGLRKVTVQCSRFPTTVLLLNQTRENPFVLFGDKKYTTGGNAPHFYASVEVMLVPSGIGLVRNEARALNISGEMRKRMGLPVSDKGHVIGRWVRARVTKTKVAPTLMREANFYIDFQKGVRPWPGLLPVLLTENPSLVEMFPEGQKVRLKDPRTGEVLDFENEGVWAQWVKQNLEVLDRQELR